MPGAMSIACDVPRAGAEAAMIRGDAGPNAKGTAGFFFDRGAVGNPA